MMANLCKEYTCSSPDCLPCSTHAQSEHAHDMHCKLTTTRMRSDKQRQLTGSEVGCIQPGSMYSVKEVGGAHHRCLLEVHRQISGGVCRGVVHMQEPVTLLLVLAASHEAEV